MSVSQASSATDSSRGECLERDFARLQARIRSVEAEKKAAKKRGRQQTAAGARDGEPAVSAVSTIRPAPVTAAVHHLAPQVTSALPGALHGALVPVAAKQSQSAASKPSPSDRYSIRPDTPDSTLSNATGGTKVKVGVTQARRPSQLGRLAPVNVAVLQPPQLTRRRDTSAVVKSVNPGFQTVTERAGSPPLPPPPPPPPPVTGVRARADYTSASQSNSHNHSTATTHRVIHNGHIVDARKVVHQNNTTIQISKPLPPYSAESDGQRVTGAVTAHKPPSRGQTVASRLASANTTRWRIPYRLILLLVCLAAVLVTCHLLLSMLSALIAPVFSSLSALYTTLSAPATILPTMLPAWLGMMGGGTGPPPTTSPAPPSSPTSAADPATSCYPRQQMINIENPLPFLPCLSSGLGDVASLFRRGDWPSLLLGQDRELGDHAQRVLEGVVDQGGREMSNLSAEARAFVARYENRAAEEVRRAEHLLLKGLRGGGGGGGGGGSGSRGASREGKNDPGMMMMMMMTGSGKGQRWWPQWRIWQRVANWWEAGRTKALRRGWELVRAMDEDVARWLDGMIEFRALEMRGFIIGPDGGPGLRPRVADAAGKMCEIRGELGRLRSKVLGVQRGRGEGGGGGGDGEGNEIGGTDRRRSGARGEGDSDVSSAEETDGNRRAAAIGAMRAEFLTRIAESSNMVEAYCNLAKDGHRVLDGVDRRIKDDIKWLTEARKEVDRLRRRVAEGLDEIEEADCGSEEECWKAVGQREEGELRQVVQRVAEFLVNGQRMGLGRG